MGIFDSFKKQLRSVIEWKDPSSEVLFYKWSDKGDEIKNASKLIINPGQGCVFVYEGKVQSVIVDSGMIEIKTSNVPFITTLKKYMQAFESEHKVGLYFFKTTNILDLKWGTPEPIKYMDPKYKFPVALRARGNYSFVIKEPENFFVNVVGSQNVFYIDDFKTTMTSRIVEPLSDFFAESGYSYADIDAQREKLSSGIKEKISKVFLELGFEITDFRIEGTTFDEDTMRRINRIADMTAEAQAVAAVGLNYAQVQQLDAMKAAAENQGGGAGLGMGLGAGIGMGNMMGNMMANQGMNATSTPSSQQAGGPPPPPIPESKMFHYVSNNQQMGPIDLSKISEQIKSGIIKKETLVWSQGMANWEKAETVSEINSLFGSVPPPIPPAMN